MIGISTVTIGGITFENTDGERILKSVFLMDVNKSECAEYLVSDDENIDKDKLAEDLLKYYRKEVTVFIDITSRDYKPYSNLVDIKLVGIKK